MDDVDSADQHSIRSEEGNETKHKKRTFLKDALGRTKTKLNKVREERVAKRQSKEHAKAEHVLDDDVNDFLAGGRASFASSQRPSLGSVAHRDDEFSAPTQDYRPSTSDSNTQPSPRRAQFVAVPRIDVSNSTRFPNARPVDPDDVLLDHSVSSPSTMPNGSLLKPEYKSRSQSASSLFSGKRRAKLRGLSVGFADVPPVIIGEGGDEAEAPPSEISRAKEARARSASPQARKPYSNAAVQPQARNNMPARGLSENAADALSLKPFMRVQTGTLSDTMSSTSSGRSPHAAPIPKPFARAQTGLSDHSITSGMPAALLPAKPDNRFVPQPLARIDTGNDLAKEFEMTLGLRTGNGSSPTVPNQPTNRTVNIVAPKPQRAPPSYEIIENNSPVIASNHQPVLNEHSEKQPSAVQQAHNTHRRENSDHIQRRPVPPSQPPPQQTRNDPQNHTILPPGSVPAAKPSTQQTPPISSSIRPNLPMQPGSQDYFPPPPDRNRKQQATVLPQQVIKTSLQSAMPDNKVPLSVVTERQDSNQSFAQRSRFRSNSNSPRPSLGSAAASPAISTIRHVTNQYFDDEGGSVHESPHTAVDLNKSGRFYEAMKHKNAPEGFI